MYITNADAHAFNDFEHPDEVHIQEYNVDYNNGKVLLMLPPCSVVEVTIG